MPSLQVCLYSHFQKLNSFKSALLLNEKFCVVPKERMTLGWALSCILCDLCSEFNMKCSAEEMDCGFIGAV